MSLELVDLDFEIVENFIDGLECFQNTEIRSTITPNEQYVMTIMGAEGLAFNKQIGKENFITNGIKYLYDMIVRLIVAIKEFIFGKKSDKKVDFNKAGDVDNAATILEQHDPINIIEFFYKKKGFDKKPIEINYINFNLFYNTIAALSVQTTIKPSLNKVVSLDKRKIVDEVIVKLKELDYASNESEFIKKLNNELNLLREKLGDKIKNKLIFLKDTTEKLIGKSEINNNDLEVLEYVFKIVNEKNFTFNKLYRNMDSLYTGLKNIQYLLETDSKTLKDKKEMDSEIAEKIKNDTKIGKEMASFLKLMEEGWLKIHEIVSGAATLQGRRIGKITLDVINKSTS